MDDFALGSHDSESSCSSDSKSSASSGKHSPKGKGARRKAILQSQKGSNTLKASELLSNFLSLKKTFSETFSPKSSPSAAKATPIQLGQSSNLFGKPDEISPEAAEEKA